MEIINIPFGEDRYYKATYPKIQIVTHHTVSNGTAQEVANYWKTLENRVATAFIIGKEGGIYKLFDPKFYAGHIGDIDKEMQKFSLPFRSCSKASIGIELVSMGGLTMKSGVLYDSYGKKYNGEAVHYADKFRGYEYFAKYHDKQIQDLGILLKHLCEEFSISKEYQEDMWSLSKNALSGVNGVFSHTSFRSDKSDCHPQQEMVEMLKSI